MTRLPRLDVRRWVTATVVSLGLALTTLAASPASADEASDAPVTAPDRVTVWTGSGAEANVLANDTDPQGDKLAVCRVGASSSPQVEAVVSDQTLIVFASNRARAGTYTLTYYACDFDYLTPGTVTVTVKKTYPIRVTKLKARPGKLKVANPNDNAIVLMWGGPREEQPDGMRRVRGHKSIVITVKRTRIAWIAFMPRGGLVGQGIVRNIKLPKGSDRAVPERAFPLSPRADRLWAARG